MPRAMVRPAMPHISVNWRFADARPLPLPFPAVAAAGASWGGHGNGREVGGEGE